MLLSPKSDRTLNAIAKSMQIDQYGEGALSRFLYPLLDACVNIFIDTEGKM